MSRCIWFVLEPLFLVLFDDFVLIKKFKENRVEVFEAVQKLISNVKTRFLMVGGIQGTYVRSVSTLNSKLLPELPVRDPFRMFSELKNFV